MLRAALRHEQHIAILELIGDLTEETGKMLPGLQELLERKELKIILEMSQVKYVNSAGLSTFVDSYKAALRADAKLALCQLQPQVLKVFKLARVEVFIPIYPTLGQAFKHFGVLLKETEGPPREQLLVIEPGMNLGDEIQRLLTANKEQVNYRLSRVPSTAEALRFLDLRPTNVIILDLALPKRDCELFLGQLRTHPQHKIIPVLVATPDSGILEADYLIRNGADDLLRVPLSPYEVSSRLRMALTLHYAMSKDDGSIARMFETRLPSVKYDGPKYPKLQ